MADGPRISLPLNCEGVPHELFNEVIRTAEELVDTPRIGGLITRINVNFTRFNEEPWGTVASVNFQVYLEIGRTQHWITKTFGYEGNIGTAFCAWPEAKPRDIQYLDTTRRVQDLTRNRELQFEELLAGLKVLISFLVEAKEREANSLAHANDLQIAVIRLQEKDLQDLLAEPAT